jgi:hypothetical protein
MSKNLKEALADENETNEMNQFMQQHPELDCIGYRRRLLEIVKPLKVSVVALEKALQLFGSEFRPKTADQMRAEQEAAEEAQIEANQREFDDLVEKIVAAQRPGPEQKTQVLDVRASFRRGKTVLAEGTSNAERVLREQLSHYDLDSLRQRWQNILNERKWRGMPTQELRSQTPAPKQYGRYLRIPDTLTAHDILVMDPEALKDAMQKYGDAQLTARLQQR